VPMRNSMPYPYRKIPLQSWSWSAR